MAKVRDDSLTDSETTVFVIPEKVSAARDWYLRPLDREFDLPREVQLFDASSGAIAHVIWLITRLKA
jgi:hypothetical protein